MQSGKIYNALPVSGKSDRLPITPPADKSPKLGMTYLRLGGSYGTDALAAYHKRHSGNVSIYTELDRFRVEMRQSCKNMTDFLKTYSSHHAKVKSNAHLENEKKRLSEKYGLTQQEITHIHIRRGGTGPTVLWGFVYDNIFEVLSIDPDHSTLD